MLTPKQSLGISTSTNSFLNLETLTLVTERSALERNDFVDWSNVGKVFDPFAPNFADFLTHSFVTNSTRGLRISIDIQPAAIAGITPPFIFKTSFEKIPSNFASGDYILFTGFIPGGFPAIGNANPLTIAFDRPVQAAGTQFTVDDLSEYTIFIEAFDLNDRSLGNFSVPGTSSEALDNSAQFVGLKSEIANIKKIVYSYKICNEFNSSSQPRAFGINFLDLHDTNIS